MSKAKQKRERGVTYAADGGVLTKCRGCGMTPISSRWLMACPRCAALVCRCCAEDKPHLLSDEGLVCELPAGQEPKDWGYLPGEPIVSRFATPCEDKPVRCSTTE